MIRRLRRRGAGREREFLFLFRSALETDRRFRLAFFGGLLTLLTILALLVNPPSAVAFDVGQVADRTVKASRSVTFVSDSLTEAARQRAAESVPRVYRHDPSVVAQQVGALTQSLARIAQARADTQSALDQRIATVQVEVGNTAAPVALEMANDQWSVLQTDLPDYLRGILTPDVRAEDVDQARRDAAQGLPGGWSAAQKAVATPLLQRNIVPNSTYDPAATDRARQDARQSASSVVVQVLAGEVVVRDGAVVTPEVVEKLRALGLTSAGLDWKGIVGIVAWAFLVSFMYALYLERYQPEVWRDTRKVGLAMAALVLVVAVSRLAIPGHTLLAYFVPFAAVGMALSILVGGRTALATQMAAALHVGMMSGQVEFLSFALVPSILGMIVLRSGTTARDFLSATLFVAAGNVGVLETFLLTDKSADVLGALQLAGAGAGNAVVSAALAYLGIVLVGHLLRITTVFELRELGDPNHPLLRELLLRTPGTYHHSLLVANLAERAAEVVGADPLVARVGAYYHDIGKMRNPSAFIENQAGGDNPHDNLDPLVSAQIVAAHVRDGLALAERYRLPAVIREVIPGHHGTSIVKYFYQLAVARGITPDPESFKYPGPRAHSREAGIVMLADGVEASVRSLPAKTIDEIRRMVDKIVDERVAEGQLDECELTLADISRIKEAFVELLAGVYHERIPYPEDRITQLPTERARTSRGS